MEAELTIQQVAAITRLSEHTLRYYERAGLLDPVSRSSSGHRRYSASDVAWIQFLNRLRATGMPIRQMQQFAALRRQGIGTAPARRTLLMEHQMAVQERILDLQRNLAAIEDKIRYYEQLEAQHGTSNGTDTVRKGPGQSGVD